MTSHTHEVPFVEGMTETHLNPILDNLKQKGFLVECKSELCGLPALCEKHFSITLKW